MEQTYGPMLESILASGGEYVRRTRLAYESTAVSTAALLYIFDACDDLGEEDDPFMFAV